MENRRMDATARKPYPSDLQNEAWALVEPLLPPPLPAGAPRTTDLREVVLVSRVDQRFSPRKMGWCCPKSLGNPLPQAAEPRFSRGKQGTDPLNKYGKC